MFTLHRYTGVEPFLALAEPSLQREEVANNLIYGVALQVKTTPERFASAPYLATVAAGGELICAAVMTPPHRLLLYGIAPAGAALDLLIGNLQEEQWGVPGVTARAELATHFAERWKAVTGKQYAVDVRLRVFELRRVEWPPLPRGHLRPAVAEDADLAWQWYCDFTREALPGDVLPTPEGVQRSIANGNVYFWDDGGPVALAAQGRRLPHGSSIGPVYTPPHLRGRGYASACVAALSQAILDRGAAYCTLFTDLSNPTSNHIYQRLGYRPVCDYIEYHFQPAIP